MYLCSHIVIPPFQRQYYIMQRNPGKEFVSFFPGHSEHFPGNTNNLLFYGHTYLVCPSGAGWIFPLTFSFLLEIFYLTDSINQRNPAFFHVKYGCSRQVSTRVSLWDWRCFPQKWPLIFAEIPPRRDMRISALPDRYNSGK
jgi:hypothetical protein